MYLFLFALLIHFIHFGSYFDFTYTNLTSASCPQNSGVNICVLSLNTQLQISKLFRLGHTVTH